MALVWEGLESLLPGLYIRTILGKIEVSRLVVRRAKVPGGWLVCVAGAGVTFYPDPDHAWDGNSLP